MRGNKCKGQWHLGILPCSQSPVGHCARHCLGAASAFDCLLHTALQVASQGDTRLRKNAHGQELTPLMMSLHLTDSQTVQPSSAPAPSGKCRSSSENNSSVGTPSGRSNVELLARDKLSPNEHRLQFSPLSLPCLPVGHSCTLASKRSAYLASLVAKQPSV